MCQTFWKLAHALLECGSMEARAFVSFFPLTPPAQLPLPQHPISIANDSFSCQRVSPGHLLLPFKSPQTRPFTHLSFYFQNPRLFTCHPSFLLSSSFTFLLPSPPIHLFLSFVYISSPLQISPTLYQYTYHSASSLPPLSLPQHTTSFASPSLFTSTSASTEYQTKKNIHRILIKLTGPLSIFFFLHSTYTLFWSSPFILLIPAHAFPLHCIHAISMPRFSCNSYFLSLPSLVSPPTSFNTPLLLSRHTSSSHLPGLVSCPFVFHSLAFTYLALCDTYSPRSRPFALCPRLLPSSRLSPFLHPSKLT